MPLTLHLMSHVGKSIYLRELPSFSLTELCRAITHLSLHMEPLVPGKHIQCWGLMISQE